MHTLLVCQFTGGYYKYKDLPALIVNANTTREILHNFTTMFLEFHLGSIAQLTCIDYVLNTPPRINIEPEHGEIGR